MHTQPCGDGKYIFNFGCQQHGVYKQASGCDVEEPAVCIEYYTIVIIIMADCDIFLSTIFVFTLILIVFVGCCSWFVRTSAALSDVFTIIIIIIIIIMASG